MSILKKKKLGFKIKRNQIISKKKVIMSIYFKAEPGY